MLIKTLEPLPQYHLDRDLYRTVEDYYQFFNLFKEELDYFERRI
jgi:hypothetical protein